MALNYSVARWSWKSKSATICILGSKYLYQPLIPTLKPNIIIRKQNDRMYAMGAQRNTNTTFTFSLPNKPIKSTEPLLTKQLQIQVLSQVPSRAAGHAKWQNIAATKKANDAKVSQTCQRYANQINIAIKTNNNESNPKLNVALAKVIADAQSEDVPKSTIENAIKRAQNIDAVMVESVVEVRGPGNTFIIAETFSKSTKTAEQLVQNVLKKAKAGITEKGILNTFERRGVIIAKGNSEITLDSAEEDAIECGAEEIIEAEVPSEDGRKVFEFFCSPIDFAAVRNNLSAKSLKGGVAYDIISANIEYVPSGHYVDIESQKEEDAFRKLIDLLNENEIVTGVYHNCTLDTAN